MSSIREQFVAALMSRVGCPYIWGARGPDQFDCCGLVEWGMAQIGRPFKHDICSHDLLTIFHNNKVIRGAEKIGSLYLYTSKNNRERVSHVTVFFRQWKNGKKWLIGANGGGSVILTEDMAIASGAMVKVVPDVYRSSDMFLILDPFIKDGVE